MKFTIKTNDKVQIKNYGSNIDVVLPLQKAYMEEAQHFETIKPDTYYTVEIKRMSDKKTKSQNDYAWELITALSQEKKPYIAPIDIYRQLARDFRTFYICTIPLRDEEKFIKSWEQRGMAWFCEVMDRNSKFVAIKCLYGMSTWTKEETSDFIEILKSECKEQGIPTERFIE